MKNINKIFRTVIIFTAIMLMAENAECQNSVSQIQQTEEISTSAVEVQEQNVSAADTEINLNFNFNDNKKTFIQALDILLIGFSIVFVVMIIFIFVSTGIDKMFPYKKE